MADATKSAKETTENIIKIIKILLILVAIYVIFIGWPVIKAIFAPLLRLFGASVEELPNVQQISPLGFLLVIVTAALVFLAYVLYFLWGTDNTVKNFVKILLNVAPVCLFFGSLLIEVAVFNIYLQKTTTITLAECAETFKITTIEEIPKFLTCVFTGYYPSAGVSFTSVAFVTFVIFFWFLPFIFLFAFLYGLFQSVMVDMFGGGSTGKTVTTVLTFIVATYGARQMIGAFLIDFFAYGSWGLVGIFIPSILAVGIKRILDLLIPVKKMEEILKETLWGAVGGTWAEIKRLEDEIKELHKTITILSEKGEKFDLVRDQVKELSARLDAAEKMAEVLPRGKETAKGVIQALKQDVETLKKIVK